MSAARQRRFVRLFALVVLLGAILPNVTYVGHWTVRGLQATTAAASSDGHANHCHGSSACADQAVYGLQWWSEGPAAPALDGGRERPLTPGETVSPADPFGTPLDPPPRYA